MSDFVWDDLKYFALVASEGSVSSAARVEGVEHSTVVRRITRLEATLNIRLFHRLARGWQLTEEGELLRGRAESIEHQMFDLTRFIQTRGTFAGSVTVTAPPDLLSEVLAPVLVGFKKKYPEVELRLFGDTREANLSKGEADIALRMTEVHGSELVTQKICEVAYHFYGNEDLEKADPTARRFIGYSDTHQSYLNDMTRKQAGERPMALRTRNLRVSLAAACEGVGVALLPAFFAASRPQLRIVDDPPAPLTRPIYLVMQRDMRNSGRVRVLVDHIKAKLPKLL